MTFVVILITLLVERFFDWSHLRHWQWFNHLQHKAVERFKGKSPYLILTMTILPLLALVFLLGMLMQDWLYGFAGFIFQILVLLYCLGPQNLWADAYSSINALTAGDDQFAARKLKTTFDITEDSASHRSLLDHLFIAANGRVFAPVFWFCIAGPCGVLFYRLIALSVGEEAKLIVSAELASAAGFIEAILDWLPVRIFTCLFALGGHFVQVLNCWRKNAAHGLADNAAMLKSCGSAALGYEAVLPNDGMAEKQAVGLLDRSFVILLVLIAITAFIF